MLQQYSLQTVSIFYLLLIAVLSYYGFTKSIEISRFIGVSIGDALGSVLGALLGVFISYQLFMYARQRGMVV